MSIQYVDEKNLIVECTKRHYKKGATKTGKPKWVFIKEEEATVLSYKKYMELVGKALEFKRLKIGNESVKYDFTSAGYKVTRITSNSLDIGKRVIIDFNFVVK